LPDRRTRWYQRVPWLILLCILIVAVVESAATGSFPVGGRQALHIILDEAVGGVPGWLRRDWLIAAYSGADASVVWDIRMPRIVLGMAVGGLIALSATMLQGAFRNPLADPGLIGISSGGAWFALLVSLANWNVSETLARPVAAFFGCLAITLLLWRIANHHGMIEVVTLILAGVAIQAVLTAVIGISNAINGDVLQQATSFWATGGLAQARWEQVRVAIAVLAVGWGLARLFAERLNVFSLGDREATHLGIEVNATRLGIVVLVSVLMAVAVAYAGAIAFVGLIVPQLMTLWLGPDYRRLISSGVIGGAVVVVLTDLVARTIAAPIEIGLGVILALIGGPLFVIVLLRVRRQQGGWS
jgi:iron complex transport system permease protein